MPLPYWAPGPPCGLVNWRHGTYLDLEGWYSKLKRPDVKKVLPPWPSLPALSWALSMSSTVFLVSMIGLGYWSRSCSDTRAPMGIQDMVCTWIWSDIWSTTDNVYQLGWPNTAIDTGTRGSTNNEIHISRVKKRSVVQSISHSKLTLYSIIDDEPLWNTACPASNLHLIWTCTLDMLFNIIVNVWYAQFSHVIYTTHTAYDDWEYKPWFFCKTIKLELPQFRTVECCSLWWIAMIAVCSLEEEINWPLLSTGPLLVIQIKSSLQLESGELTR